jgi:hypothetical protein
VAISVQTYVIEISNSNCVTEMFVHGIKKNNVLVSNYSSVHIVTNYSDYVFMICNLNSKCSF